MSGCREPTCEAFICKSGTHLKDNAESIKCGVPGFMGFASGVLPGKNCDPEGDQGTCCDEGRGPESCFDMQCPEGWILKTNAASLRCKADVCTASDDKETCCVKQKCPGAISFDYGSKQKECAKVGSPVVAAASKCYDEDNCDAMTDCYAREACKHDDMTDECKDKLRVCSIKPGGTIYSSYTHSKTSTHCSHGDCTKTQESHSSGIRENHCDPDVNSDVTADATCPAD
jgi:hypothetical protein